MKLVRTERLLRGYGKLLYLARDMTHPSSRVNRVRKYRGIYEGSINTDFRFLFRIAADGYILLRIGRHDILERA
ncbi:MAG: hypothetical protein ACE5JM_03480 [Armatimonadota bacterium]